MPSPSDPSPPSPSLSAADAAKHISTLGGWVGLGGGCRRLTER